ncbi:MAG: gliding motility-associated C-terminal domain-containing protein [Bacteroidetes bacterium]|nr:gliding motility-associated C-terminal domain-containing protein [Bacteroidota bacterium]
MVFRQLLILLIVLIATTLETRGQNNGCSTLGQTPATAFPVCGTAAFDQKSVPSCPGARIPVPCNDGAPYTDINPFWYKFTCFAAGTLGFTITPKTTTDDYDWQLFDVTGHDPSDVYSQSSLFVSGNWSSNPDKTGTGTNNYGSINCAGPTFPNTNSMPTLIQGHNYLLLVSHFTDINQSGYSLVFSGGTASITDTIPAALKAVSPVCYGGTIKVALNKKMKCSSLAADGTDFAVSPLPPGVAVTAASANSCASGFDLDTLQLTLNGSLIPGNTYTVTAANGSDGNTLLDNCGNPLPAGQSLSFTLVAPQPTPMDSMVPIGCAPDQLQLIFKNGILCSSVAADGSDFSVTGPVPVTVSGVSMDCNASGYTSVIRVNLSAPIQTAGNFKITLRQGDDGNTFYDQCGLPTPSSSLFFMTSDTVSAEAFKASVLAGCKIDTVDISYPPEDGVNQWLWVFDNSDTSRAQTPPRHIYPASGTHPLLVIVSNGVCSDTLKTSIVLDNEVKAAFEVPNIICPRDYAQYKNNSTGPIDYWDWDLGDGSISSLQTPTDHLYPPTGIETSYTVRLIAGNNSMGCQDTTIQKIDVLKSCYIAVPTAFTPNGDGLNDYLYPLNAFKADNLVFKVFNREGQMVFQAHSWTDRWDGRVNGGDAPAGTYVWFLQYIDRDSEKPFLRKGTSILIR